MTDPVASTPAPDSGATDTELQKMIAKFHKFDRMGDGLQWQCGDLLLAIQKNLLQQNENAEMQNVRILLGLKYTKGYLSKLANTADAFSDDERKAADKAGATFNDCYETVRLINKERKGGWIAADRNSKALSLTLDQVLAKKKDNRSDNPYQDTDWELDEKAQKAFDKAKENEPAAVPVPLPEGWIAKEFKNPNGDPTHWDAKDRHVWEAIQKASKKTVERMKVSGGMILALAFDETRNIAHSYCYFQGKEGVEQIAAPELLALFSRLTPKVRQLGTVKIEPEAERTFVQLSAAFANRVAEQFMTAVQPAAAETSVPVKVS